MPENLLSEEKAEEKNASTGTNFSVFFFVAYILQGFACAQFGIVGQPVQYYFMDGLNLDAAKISMFMSVMMIPWIIKPVYGMISDMVPLFGWHRKSYLVLAAFVAAIAFLGMVPLASVGAILFCLSTAAMCMAISTALMVALTVEQGRIDGKTRHYFNIQEAGFYITNIFVVLGAGQLCHLFSPKDSLNYAATIASVSALLLMLLTLKALKEPKRDNDTKLNWKNFDGILSTIKSAKFLNLIVLTCLWSFTLAYGVSLYYHESKTLLFSQSFIGQLSAWTAVGTLIGVLAYKFVSKRMSKYKQTILTAVLLVTSTLSYVFMKDNLSAVLLELFHGFAALFALITIYGLASDRCSKGSEATVMAIVVSIMNISTCLAVFVGGQLYTHFLDTNYTSLVLLASLPQLISLFAIYKMRHQI